MKHKSINHGLVALAALGGMLATSCGSETDVYNPNAVVVDYNTSTDWYQNPAGGKVVS